MATQHSEFEVIAATVLVILCTVLLLSKTVRAWKERIALASKQSVDETRGDRSVASEDEESSRHGNGSSVLIVDDDPVTRKQLRKHLEKLDFRVVEVQDGPSAVKLYNEGHRFCLVLMDYEMPEMNGLSATKEIRRYDDDVVIVGSTIHDPATKQAEFLKAGANLVDIKPITATRLKELVTEYNLAS